MFPEDTNQSVTLDTLSKQNSVNEANIIQLKALLEDLSHSVDTINSSYVSKEDFAELMKELKVSTPISNTPKKLDNISMEKEAKKLFDEKNIQRLNHITR